MATTFLLPTGCRIRAPYARYTWRPLDPGVLALRPDLSYLGQFALDHDTVGHHCDTLIDLPGLGLTPVPGVWCPVADTVPAYPFPHPFRVHNMKAGKGQAYEGLQTAVYGWFRGPCKAPSPPATGMDTMGDTPMSSLPLG